MTRKYRVLLVGDHTNPSGSHPSAYAELEVPDGLTDDGEILERYLKPAALAAWIVYSDMEKMAEAVDKATKP